jgi:glycosyltransferase involved in cell wall biosynthesis
MPLPGNGKHIRRRKKRMQPLVSVITPTWQRHNLLLRCIESVEAQDYSRIEHVIVSDGPDPELIELLTGYNVILAQLPEHSGRTRWGVEARLHGIEISSGEFIAYLDDDNQFRPDHISTLANLLTDSPNAIFGYGREIRHPSENFSGGASPPVLGGIDTSIMINRRSAFDVATWRDDGKQQTIDWDLAKRWIAAGAEWVWSNKVTVDYWDGPR